MKLFTTLFLAVILCAGIHANAFGERINNVRDLDTNGNGIYEPGEVNCDAEYQCGPCVSYCPVTRFKAENYCETHCVEEPYTVEKQCCRWVDEPYTVKKCRYVPEYYTKTCEKQCCRKVPQYYQVTCCKMVPEYYTQCYTKQCCRKVPQYYEVQCCRKVPQYYTTCEQKCRTRYVKEQKCKYVPYTCVVQKTCDSCDSNSCASGNYAQRPAQNAQWSNQAAAPAQAPAQSNLNQNAPALQPRVNR